MSEEIKNKVSNKKKRKFKQPTLESPESPSIIQKTLSNIKQSQIPSINGQKDSSPSNKKKRLLSATEEIGKNAPNFQFKNGEKWYEEYREISEEQLPKTANNELSGEKACSSRQLDQQEILALEQQALKLLRASAESHTPSVKNHESKFMETIQRSGTFADRISALQLRVQRTPIFSLEKLDSIVQTINSKSLRESHSLLKTLQQIFLDELIPPNRKLIPFAQRPLSRASSVSNSKTSNRLILWVFESELKKCYQRFVHALEKLAGSDVEGVAKSACRSLVNLLTERSEQEQLILSAIVNKMGHPERHVGSLICQLLQQLIQRHPNMRLVVVTEVEQLVFRKNVGLKAYRYAVHFLSQIQLRAGEWELATKLIKIYLNLFRVLLAATKRDEADAPDGDEEQRQQPWSRIQPLLLSGINRAFPYLKSSDELLPELDNLYTIVQTTKLETSLLALRLLFKIHSKAEGVNDRFYSAFYRRLLGIETSTSVGSTFFQLLEQVLRHDLVESRVRAFLKRLFQLALCSHPAFACASLLTAYAVVKERPQILRLRTGNEFPSKFLRKESKIMGKEIKQEKYIKHEPNSSREDFCFYNDDDEEEEHYEDVESEGEASNSNKTTIKKKNGLRTPCGWTWVSSLNNSTDRLNDASKSSDVKGEKSPAILNRGNATAYDPLARNPLFAGADFVMDTELYTLANHYHPSVSRFAQSLIRGEPIDYSGDPLVDFSSIRFLDRFAFKNPKKAQSARDKKKKDREEEGSDLSDAEFESVMEKELGVHWRGNDDDEGDDFGQEDSDDEEGLDDEELDEEEGNLLSGEDEMGDEEDGDDGLEDSDDNDDKEEEYESQLESDDDDEE